MDNLRYSGSPWSRFGSCCGIAMAGAAFRTGDLVIVAITATFGFMFIHELFRQWRPMVMISKDFLTWQPKALWRPEVSVPLKDIVRVNRKWSHRLSVRLRNGSTHRIDLSGIAFSDRKSISKAIKERIPAPA